MKNWVLDKRQEDRVELRRGGGESLRPHLLPYPVFPIHKSGLEGGGGLGTPLYGLYGDVPLVKVWFLVASLSGTGYIISCESFLNRAWMKVRRR